MIRESNGVRVLKTGAAIIFDPTPAPAPSMREQEHHDGQCVGPRLPLRKADSLRVEELS
jgi:hypothetical protein